MARQINAEEFERCTSELMQRLVEDDLGWEVTQNRIQSPGPQYGKDIQFRWRVDNHEYSWHIECKSHRSGSLPKEQVMPKLYEVWRSDHQIDVWCLALAHVEPSQAVDEFFATARRMLRFPFGISILSPADHDLPGLFACHRDLYERIYPGRPWLNLSAETREARIEAFGAFMLDESRDAVEPNDGGWTLVTPSALERMGILPDDAAAAIEYLRGFDPCEWDAIAHEWGAARPKAVGPIFDSAKNVDPGIAYGWCVGPAGDGKTTAARTAAWALAQNPDLCVLWGEAELDSLTLPLSWLEGLDPGIQVVFFVDGTSRLEGIGELQKRERQFKAEGRRVACVLVDRGIVFARSPTRRQLSARRASFRRLDLPTLDENEISSLIERVEAREILHLSAAHARRRLGEIGKRELRSDGSSWLLPTLMEITDPKERGFEDILDAFLQQLVETDEAAMSLMLAAALAHSARVRLPATMAERCTGGAGRYGRAIEVLQSELLRQSVSDPDAQAPKRGGVRTYSKLVAESIVRLVCGSTRHGHMEEVCHMLVIAAGETRAGDQLPYQEFQVLDKVASFLLHELDAFELCACWFEDWIRLDSQPANFIAMQRLGDCLIAWLKEALASDDRELAEDLASRARATFVEAIEVSDQALAEDLDASPIVDETAIMRQQRFTFRSFGVLEGLAGTHLDNQHAFLQSAFLSVLGMEPSRGGQQSIANLALNLVELKRFEQSALAAGAVGELEGSNRVVDRLKRILAREGVEIPPDGLAKLGGMIAELATDLLLPGLNAEDWPYSDEARKTRLLAALPAIGALLPGQVALDGLATKCGRSADVHGS